MGLAFKLVLSTVDDGLDCGGSHEHQSQGTAAAASGGVKVATPGSVVQVIVK